MQHEVVLRRIRPGEEAETCALVRRVFDEFVAPELAAEGVAEFHAYARPEALRERLSDGHVVLVAELAESSRPAVPVPPVRRVVGALELRHFAHVSMLFVEVRGRGIGRALLARGIALCREHDPERRRITVHASSSAVPVYEKSGFRASGPERIVNGIRYVPMILGLEART